MAIVINILSFFTYILSLEIFSNIASYQLYNYFYRIYSQPTAYLSIFLILGFTSVLDLAAIRWVDFKYYTNIFLAL